MSRSFAPAHYVGRFLAARRLQIRFRAAHVDTLAATT
jgi:hypothetical protein